MMESLKGKFLVRRSKLANGKPVLILCGLAIPQAAIEKFSDKDEMWVAEILVTDVMKYESVHSTGYNGSPEDFLMGKEHTIEHYWKPKK